MLPLQTPLHNSDSSEVKKNTKGRITEWGQGGEKESQELIFLKDFRRDMDDLSVIKIINISSKIIAIYK